IIKELAGMLQGDITLIGSSLGAYLACLFAQSDHCVKQLVLIAPAFQFISRQEKVLGRDVLDKWRETGSLEVYHYEYQENRRLHYGIIDDVRKYDRQPLTRKLPALLMHGINDRSVPYRLSIDYLKINPEARLLLLNSDHTMTEIVETLYQYTEHFLGL
ncbi:MAG: YqiA/YcfP family alpha/beta fold hydrolase, partial [Calditrichia bacterium]